MRKLLSENANGKMQIGYRTIIHYISIIEAIPKVTPFVFFFFCTSTNYVPAWILWGGKKKHPSPTPSGFHFLPFYSDVVENKPSALPGNSVEISAEQFDLTA